jgi:glutaminase
MPQNPVQLALQTIYEQVKNNCAGEVATYIPELGRANPEDFAICLATVDGHVYRLGNYELPFTIQSISKPFVFGMALEDHGLERVLQKVKVEPSGEAFNSISLEQSTGRPLNPMINVGAIAMTALINGENATERKARLLAMFGRYTGRKMTIDEAVFHSERETGHRNHAIAYLLRNANIIEDRVEESLELYFEQCSVAVTCEDIAVMAATLANQGRNPRTGEVALQPAYVESVLSVMTACGMYDYSGAWIFNVGMPAKSGVSGGIMAVLPGQFGLGVFSPPLDAYGNSVRGIAVCEQLSQAFGLHLLKVNFTPATVLRVRYTLADVPSNRLWGKIPSQRLKELGKRVQVFELQGALGFGTAEVLFRELVSHLEGIEMVVFHCKRVQSMDAATSRLFANFIQYFIDLGGQILFVYLESTSIELLQQNIAENLAPSLHFFENSDLAKEWCEESLLAKEGIFADDQEELALGQHTAFDTFSPEAHAILEKYLQRCTYRAGEKIIRSGEPATAIYFLMQGRISVNLTLANQSRHRITTLAAGSIFGEMAILDGGKRSADVDAQTDMVCLALSAEKLPHLQELIPGIYEKICDKLVRDLSTRLRKANSEILALES